MADVLVAVGGMDLGGIETFIMNVYRKIDPGFVRFDFLLPHDRNYFFADEIRDRGGRLYFIDESRKHPIKMRKKLDAFFCERCYDVVWENKGSLNSMAILFAAKRSGVPRRILHSHASTSSVFDIRSAMNYAIHSVNRRRIGAATDFYACSPEAADWFGFDRSGKAVKWKFVPNGIDVARFAFDDEKRNRVRDALGFGVETFVVGNVARLVSVKNHIFLLESFAFLQSSCSKARLLLVGSGPMKAEIIAKASELGIWEKVTLLEDRMDTDELYSAMDVFAFPSKAEGLGLALIEAQAAGLPCVVSKGVPSRALICEGCQVVDLADGATKWADEIKHVATFGRNSKGPEKVRNAGFDIARVAADIQADFIRVTKDQKRGFGV